MNETAYVYLTEEVLDALIEKGELAAPFLADTRNAMTAAALDAGQRVRIVITARKLLRWRAFQRTAFAKREDIRSLLSKAMKAAPPEAFRFCMESVPLHRWTIEEWDGCRWKSRS